MVALHDSYARETRSDDKEYGCFVIFGHLYFPRLYDREYVTCLPDPEGECPMCRRRRPVVRH